MSDFPWDGHGLANVGHAANSVLVRSGATAGPFADLPLTPSTVVGRGPTGDVIALPFATIGANSMDLFFAFGDADDGTGGGNIVPNGGAGIFSWFMRPWAKFTDIPGGAYAGTPVDANLDLTRVFDYEVIGDWSTCELQVFVNFYGVTGGAGIRLTVSQNGLCDSSPIDFVVNSATRWTSQQPYAFADGDRIGLRFGPSGAVAGTSRIKLTAHVRLTR
jgi:hypothetical protein